MTKATKPAKLTVENIKAVIQAKQREIQGFKLEDHIYEQIIWRRTQVMDKSPDCWSNGTCKVCGCEILGKTMEDRKCEGTPPCYPNMIKDPKQWEAFKKFNNIKLFI